MRQLMRAVTLAGAGVAALLVPALPAWADGATVQEDANVRSAPTTDSEVVAELAAGDEVEVECWVIGEPTFGDDQYGAMWLQTTDPGFVHSFLVTPVDVPACEGVVYEPGPLIDVPPATVPDLELPNIEGPDGVYYDDCQDAVAQGTAPVLRDENGYREELDADNDGVGCEWVPEDE
jgi:hypothetical protein